VAFHFIAASGLGPLVEFLLEFLVGLGADHVGSGIHTSMLHFMSDSLKMAEAENSAPLSPDALYCPNCAREIPDPLTCGDCSAVICRTCGTPLESSSDLGIG